MFGRHKPREVSPCASTTSGLQAGPDDVPQRHPIGTRREETGGGGCGRVQRSRRDVVMGAALLPVVRDDGPPGRIA